MNITFANKIVDFKGCALSKTQSQVRYSKEDFKIWHDQYSIELQTSNKIFVNEDFATEEGRNKRFEELQNILIVNQDKQDLSFTIKQIKREIETREILCKADLHTLKSKYPNETEQSLKDGIAKYNLEISELQKGLEVLKSNSSKDFEFN